MRVKATLLCVVCLVIGVIGCGDTEPDRTVNSVAVTGNSSVSVDATTQLAAAATFSNGDVENVTSSSAWTSSNEAVATVSVGLVTGRGVGSANINATYQGVAGSPLGLQVTPSTSLNADFRMVVDEAVIAAIKSVIPTANVPPNQCPITGINVTNPQQGPTANYLGCVFDAGTSTPAGGITSYEWEFPVGGRTATGVTVSGRTIGLGCGNPPGAPFPLTTGGYQRTIRLTVVGPGGVRSQPRDLPITFTVVGVC
jgi:hypothetical protein